MDTGSATIILKALDCLGRRAEVTSQNIANAGTPGYRPLRLSFEQELAAAASRGDAAVRGLEISPDRAALPPSINGNASMRLDLEMATASSTALRYAALVDVLNRQMQIQASVIPGNN